MLRLGTSLANVFQHRTIRPQYVHTQGYPYAAVLDPNFVRTGGQIAGTTTTGVTGNTLAAILPGSVLVKEVGETVTLSGAKGAGQRAFGLSANFVGGALDELAGNSQIGVWRGVGSIYEILAPAFNSTNALSEGAAEAGTAATEVYLDSDATGRLAPNAAGAAAVNTTARLISAPSLNAVIVECLV